MSARSSVFSVVLPWNAEKKKTLGRIVKGRTAWQNCLHPTSLNSSYEASGSGRLFDKTQHEKIVRNMYFKHTSTYHENREPSNHQKITCAVFADRSRDSRLLDSAAIS